MSDPIVSAEIEDVLSAIRRLVSSNDRAAKHQESVQQSGDLRPAEQGRLVLTPALRVDGAVGRQVGSELDDAALARSDALKARVAELEEVVARQAGQWEPDGATANANSGRSGVPLPWEDLAPGDDKASAAKPRQPEARGADSDRLADKTDLLNSTELRDLIADIVRQELQGAMGERATRNLHKLVRREIHRALADHNQK